MMSMRFGVGSVQEMCFLRIWMAVINHLEWLSVAELRGTIYAECLKDNSLWWSKQTDHCNGFILGINII